MNRRRTILLLYAAHLAAAAWIGLLQRPTRGDLLLTKSGAGSVPLDYTPIADPTAIAGLQYWFDGSDSTKLYLLSTFLVNVSADGDPVGGWKDSNGNVYPASQAVLGQRPTYKTNVQNGKSAVLLDGVSSFLSTATVTHGIGTGDYWFCCVAKMPGSFVVGEWSMYGNGLNNPTVARNGTETKWAQDMPNGSINTSAVSLSTSTAYVLEATRSGGTVSFFINGSADVTFARATSVANSACFLGQDGGNGEWGDMYLCDLTLYNIAPTTAQRKSLVHYFGTKWGIAVSP